jgi:hypothetical protein
MSVRQHPQAPALALAITLILGLLAAPLAAQAQQAARMYRIELARLPDLALGTLTRPVRTNALLTRDPG